MRFDKKNGLAFANFLRAKYEAWTGAPLVSSFPSYIGIDVSSICQLRCPHCPTGVENERRNSAAPITFRQRTMLSSDLFDALLDELGEYVFLIMFFNWGEPLLNKELPGLIAKAKALDICTEIHSNFSLRLSDKFIEELLTSGIDELAASIDGFSQETYATYRRGGDFGLAKGNLERCATVRDRLGLKTKLIWNFLVFSFNEHEIEPTRRHCEERGLIFNAREAYTDNPDWLPSYRRHQTNAINASVTPASQPGSPCAWHYDYTMVNADGSVSPCCAPWDQKDDFGLVVPGVTSFADVWNNGLYRKSRAAFAGRRVKGLDKVNSLCLQCPFGENIQHLYSFLDKDVIAQFNRVLKGSHAVLDRAFGLLGDKAAFVDFYAKEVNGWSRAVFEDPASRLVGGAGGTGI